MKKILVIEDAPNIRENIAEFLEIKKYEVLTAENGADALGTFENHQPDLVICDVKMPRMGGFELKARLNEDERLKHIPFLFLTAATQKTDIAEGNALGATAYLTKPFEMDDLIGWVDRLLRD
jgi:CheY-like chemotaxis protein